MHQLHKALDEDEHLRLVVDGLSSRIQGNALKHALILDLNPFWLLNYRRVEAGLPELKFSSIPEFGLPISFSLQLGIGGPLDLSLTFPSSDKLTQQFFGRATKGGPFLLRIFAKPAPDATSDWYETRRQLVAAARETSIATIVETQEPARLLAGTGDRLQSASGSVGTLGGFLRDGANGPTYAVTCGHVIHGGPVTMPASGHYLGQCVHHRPPVPLPTSVACTSSCNHMTALDVALIDVRAVPVTNLATNMAKIVSPGDIVYMHGATSGTVRYEIGGAVVEHLIGGSCWNRLFLFHAPVSSGVLPVGVSVIFTHPPQDGDSGAWLVRNASEWVGMVVAGNALHGFALASTHVLTEADIAFRTQLQLV